MSNNGGASGNQTIKCSVASCRHNAAQCACNLTSIDVHARKNQSSGKACDESLCHSYDAR